MYEKCSILKDTPTRTTGSTGAVDPQVKSAIQCLGDAKRFLAAGYPNTAAEWLIAEVERLKEEADLAEAYKQHWKETDDRCCELQAEVERLTADLAYADSKATETELQHKKVLQVQRESLTGECRRLSAEVERLEAENSELSQHVCSECGPENYGWVFNRVEGKAACGCMTEAEPFQILLKALEEIHRAATGEHQIAEDDTEGMAWVAKAALTAQYHQ